MKPHANPNVPSRSGRARLPVFLCLVMAAAAWPARENLAHGKVCKASSVEGMLTPDKAVDGPKSQGSRWGSNYGTDKNKDSAWFFVDLGKAYSIDSIAIYWEHSGAKLYTIQTWNSVTDTPSYNDNGWTTVLTDTSLQYQPRPVDMCLSFLKLTPVNARYLRVRCYKRLFEFGYSIMEFEAYGNGASTALQLPGAASAGNRPGESAGDASGHSAGRSTSGASQDRKPVFRFRDGREFSPTGRVLP